MKNKIFTLIFTIIGFSSFSQTTQGTKMIGGDAGFSFSRDKHKVGSVSTDGTRYSEFNISPNVGYFIIDNLAIGVRLDISGERSRVKDQLVLAGGRREDSKSKSFTLAFGPFGRYYIPMGTKSAFFGEVNTGFGFLTSRRNSVNGAGREVTIKNPNRGLFQFGIGPGYTYFITENIGLEGLLQFRVERSSFKPDNADRQTFTNSGLFFKAGFQIYL